MLKCLFIFFIIFFQTNVYSAEEKTKILLHINDSYKLDHLEKSVHNIKKELGGDATIKIVMNGKAVQLMLKSNDRSVEIVNNILEKGADIGLCHNAVRNNTVDKSKLIEGLNILTEDGNVTIIKLKKEGYVYIKI